MDYKVILTEQIEALKKYQDKCISATEACEIARTIKELVEFMRAI